MAIGYTELDFVNGSAPALSAANLNHIDEALKDACDLLDAETVAGRAIVTAADAAAQRTSLELGDSATKNVGTGAGDVAAGNAPAAAQAAAEATAAGALAGHVAALDPHTQYAKEADLGDSAGKNVGTGAGDVAAGNAPAGAVTTHESTYAHANLPTAAGKTAADGLGTAGIIGVATRGVEDSTKVIPATGADVAALLAAGGYLTEFDGVTWDEATDTYSRFGRAVTDPNYLKVQKGMRRCVLAADGTVAYYLCPTNSALKEDGVTASVLDGTDGNVMVEIPKFYIDYSYVGTLHTWKISEHPLPGFDLHPLFLSDTTELDKAYIGAFEAVLYDVSLSKHVSGNGVGAGAAEFSDVDNSITCAGLTAPFENITVGQEITISGTVSNNGTKVVATVESAQKITVTTALVTESAASCTIDTTKDTTNDKLASVSGFSPITKITRANARKMASNVGTGWTQETFDMASAVQLLYLIEYGTFYAQDPVGPNLLGITGVSDWTTYNNLYPIAKTGNSVSVGNATANTAASGSPAATEKSKYLTYRGIENPFGHIWKWIDGFNINANVGYVCNNSANFADNTISNYTLVGTMPSTDGYQNTLLNINRGFLPATVGSPGDANDQITDYYYQSTGWRVVCLGGASNNGTDAGFFYWSCNSSSAYASRAVGTRLGFRK